MCAELVACPAICCEVREMWIGIRGALRFFEDTVSLANRVDFEVADEWSARLDELSQVFEQEDLY